MPRPRRVDPAATTIGNALVQWETDLSVDKSPKTITTYLEAVGLFQRWLAAQHPGIAALDQIGPEHVREWLLNLREAGRTPATQANRYRSLRQFFGWAEREDLVGASPMANIPIPRQEEVLTPILSLSDLKAILKTADGREFEHIRDRAMLRLLMDTGMRRQECAGLAVDDLDFSHDVAIVMGKGNRQRACPFGKATAADLRRYLRVRESHPHHHRHELWLGYKGPLGASAIRLMLQRRARAAGLHQRVFVHQLRHTWASEAMKRGLSEGDLMKLGGWRSRDMLSRYGAAAADERAQAAYRSISLGDRL